MNRVGKKQHSFKEQYHNRRVNGKPEKRMYCTIEERKKVGIAFMKSKLTGDNRFLA